MNVFYKISIDRVNANYISGWCFHRIFPHRTVRLACYQGDTYMAEARASMFREDLLELGVHPSGKCGFELITDRKGGFDFGQPLTIRLKEKGTVLVDLSGKTIDYGETNLYRHLKKVARRRKKLPQTAVFMHIPKTAGTSFNTLAQSLFPKGTAIHHIELLPEKDYRDLADTYNYISGHLRFGQLKEIFSADNAAFYTILREPYAQLQSHLKWLIQTAENPKEKYFKATNPVIYNLGRKLGQVGYFDIQALSEFVQTLSGIEAAFVDNLQTRYFLDRQPERVSNDDLAIAVANSRLFKLIGLTEHYDAFVCSFSEMNSIKLTAPAGRMNISKTEPLFDCDDKQVREILQPLVQADLQLYQSVGASG